MLAHTPSAAMLWAQMGHHHFMPRKPRHPPSSQTSFSNAHQCIAAVTNASSAVQSGGYVLSDRLELAARLREMGSCWWEAHAEKLLFEQPRVYNALALKHKKLSGGTDAEKEAFIFFYLGLGFPGAYVFVSAQHELPVSATMHGALRTLAERVTESFQRLQHHS